MDFCNALQNEIDQISAILKKELLAIPVERNVDVMLNELYRQACIKEYGVPYARRERMRQREGQRIIDHMNEDIKARYGPYANIRSSRVRHGSLEFSDNLQGVYRTPKGWVYGTFRGGFLRYVFFTTHAIDRFKERANPDLYGSIISQCRIALKADSSTLDVIGGILLNAVSHHKGGIEFAHSLDGCLYINVRVGVIVFNKYADKIFVAITFLKPDMLNTENLQWYETNIETYNEETSFEKRFEHSSKISKPCFYDYNGVVIKF